jgi:hypothetical protein
MAAIRCQPSFSAFSKLPGFSSKLSATVTAPAVTAPGVIAPTVKATAVKAAAVEAAAVKAVMSMKERMVMIESRSIEAATAAIIIVIIWIHPDAHIGIVVGIHGAAAQDRRTQEQR